MAHLKGGVGLAARCPRDLLMSSVAARAPPKEKPRTPSNGPSSATYLSRSERALRMLSAESRSKYLKY